MSNPASTSVKSASAAVKKSPKIAKFTPETCEIIDATDRAAWDHFVQSHPEANFLQSWDFYTFYQNLGRQVVRRLVVQKSTKTSKSDKPGPILAAYAGVVEPAKRGRYLAIAGGPILDWQDRPLVDAVFQDIKAEAKRHHCVFARVRPQLELSDSSLELMRAEGLQKAPMYLSVEYAGILDLTQPEDEILKNASQGLRRKIRKAQKADIAIETSQDPKIIDRYYALEQAHAARQKYVAFSKAFLEKQFAAFAAHDEVIMYTAKLGDEVLAQNFMIFYGNEASYHYGVSSDLGTKYSAAPLLHLAAMQEARRRGIQRYNFWGIVGLDETSHRFFGVSQFKRSFGVTELKYTPAHDLVLDRPKYLLTQLVETARKKHRHV